jgi:two-component system sensor histidine kinase TctE
MPLLARLARRFGPEARPGSLRGQLLRWLLGPLLVLVALNTYLGLPQCAGRRRCGL